MTCKEHELVMLPTNQDDVNNKLFINTKSNKLFYRKYNLQQDTLYPMFQHLYILLDEEIKEGDWFIMNGCIIRQCSLNKGDILDTSGGLHHKSVCKKIIVTTDKSLIKGLDSFNGKPICLPQIPQSFIEYFVKQYNLGNIITKVNIEYGTTKNKAREFVEFIWVTPDNTISIKSVKDSWTRDEVIEIAAKAHSHGYSLCLGTTDDCLEFSEWIKKIL